MSQSKSGIQQRIERLLEINGSLKCCVANLKSEEDDLDPLLLGNIERYAAEMERHLQILHAAPEAHTQETTDHTQTQPNAAAGVSLGNVQPQADIAARGRRAIRVEFSVFGRVMAIQYEALSVPFEGVVIRLWLPRGIQLYILPTRGVHSLRFDPHTCILEWRIAPIDASHHSGEIRIVVPVGPMPIFFPTSIRFPSSRTYSDVKVKMLGTPEACQAVLMAEQYDVIQGGEMNE